MSINIQNSFDKAHSGFESDSYPYLYFNLHAGKKQ